MYCATNKNRLLSIGIKERDANPEKIWTTDLGFETIAGPSDY